MNEPKFTKGPWYTDKNGDIKTVEGEITVAQISWMRNEAEEAYNARLIAAAPELLEALSCLVGCIDHGSDNPEQKLNAARAAIAKATGE